MGAPLRLATIDVPLSIADQTPPDTAGPVGRLKRLINGQITKYLGATATPGVATGARVKIEQREAFVALPTTIRSNVDGSVITPPWATAELLDSLDSQLVSIDAAIPRVLSGANWTGYPAARVLTNQLTQRVMHTINGTMYAPSNAWLGGVTCLVWTQSVIGGFTASCVGFRSDNGAWVVTPTVLYTTVGAGLITQAKVVSDGAHFWVFFNNATNVLVNCYDTNGALLGQSGIALPSGSTLPGSWDVTVAASTGGYTVLYAQGAFSVFDGGITTMAVKWNGSAVQTNISTDTTMAFGFLDIAFLANDTGNGLSYLATVSSGSGALWCYEITNQVQTHFYNIGVTTGDGSPFDSITGWAYMAPFSPVNVYTVAAKLNNTTGPVGPKYDPRYRSTTTYLTTRAGVTTTIKVERSVIPVSRAFALDGDYYAVTYYQGGPGLTSGTATSTIAWTSGDFMKGPPRQPLPVAPGDLFYGSTTQVPPGDPLGANATYVGGDASSYTYTFAYPPASILALGSTAVNYIYTGGLLSTSGYGGSGNNDGNFVITSAVLSGGRLLVTVPPGLHFTQRAPATTVQNLTPYNGSPSKINQWILGGFGPTTGVPDSSWVGEQLDVEGTSQAGNWGPKPIVAAAAVGGGTYSLTQFNDGGTNPYGRPPEVIPNPVQPTASMELVLTDPSTAYEFFLQSVTFDTGYVGALISVQGNAVNANNTVYQIIQVTGTHSVIATPLNQSTNQFNSAFLNGISIAITFPNNATESLQPTWFLTPLAVTTQHTTGRWESGVAFADWRFDGQGAGFAENPYLCNLASVVSAAAGLQVVLPYRAESFSAGVTVATGNPVDTFFSTVGLKAFTLSPVAGESLAVAGELIIPGPQASEFTASGFAEQGINLGPEAPFLVSQTADGTVQLGVTPGTSYQYLVVFEFTDEDGDRIYTVPSPPLNVNVTAGNNTVTLGGNILWPTQREVTIAIYRTSIAGGTTTIQHFKITNDTDPNGAGFTFPDAVTWNFKDQRPDVEILVSEILYTDKGFLPRYPCPAFSRGVGSWCNRTWVIGYDGAIWMSGEKTEGDAVWFHPAFRFVLPTDDEPAALASMDDYLIILGAMTDWYIPGPNFPAANGQPADLPTPVRLPFANGGTGHAVTTRDGVIYSSTAGGAWIVTRNLTNVWLSQAIQTSLGLTPITDITVDQNQRVAIATGGTTIYVWDTVPGTWYEWVCPTAVTKLSVWEGNFVYADGSRVLTHTPGVYADNPAGTALAVPMTVQLAPLHLMNSVRGFGRCWAFQLQGEYKGPHTLVQTIGYGDEADWAPPTVKTSTPDPTKTYVYEINPNPEEASQFELTLQAIPTGTPPGNSATWELISADCGVDQGIARLPAAKRVA